MKTRSGTTLRALASTAVLAMAALLAACGDGDREGGSCEPCRGSQPRCDSGLTCKAASVNVTGQIVELCFAANQTRCDGYF